MIRCSRNLLTRKSISVFAKRGIALCSLSSGLAFNNHEIPLSFKLPEYVPVNAPSTTVVMIKKRSLVEECKQYIKYLWKQVSSSLQMLARLLYLFSLFSPMIMASPILLSDNKDITEEWWKLLKYCISHSGACSVKFAQWIATRPDLFPADVCRHFKDLQSQSSTLCVKDLHRILSENCGPDWEKQLNIVQDECHQPMVLGSGCVAHVYKGRIVQTNTPVAVKIIRPNVKSTMLLDLEILSSGVQWLEYLFPSLKSISLVDSVEEFYSLMQRQLNLVHEGEALDNFRHNFHIDNQSDSTYFEKIFLGGGLIFPPKRKVMISFPKPLWAHSNENVLVETLEPGPLLRDAIESCDPETKRYIASIGVNAILKMIFLDNFIHADMHPGNIIYSHIPGSEKEKICFIDAGLVAKLEPTDRRNLIALFHAVIHNDGRHAGQLMIAKSRNPSSVINEEEFKSQLAELVNDVHQHGLTLSNISVSALLQKLLMLCYQHQVKLESRYATILVALGIVEGLGRSLDPNMDILKQAAPYVIKAAVSEKIEQLKQYNL